MQDKTNTSRRASAALTDIKSIKTDIKQPLSARMTSFLEQIGNPYKFRAGDVVVRIEYGGVKSFNSAMANLLSAV
ncbi:MAG TPA: hypothetical protein DEO32_05020 [Ruminococcaceae bacterium]|nr:hypothetical protein [Oscillospiraceae bacterium]